MDDLEKTLNDILMYGRVWLYTTDEKRWYCSVEVNLTLVGAKFEIKSERDNKTALEAATQCKKRLFDALLKFDGTAFEKKEK